MVLLRVVTVKSVLRGSESTSVCFVLLFLALPFTAIGFLPTRSCTVAHSLVCIIYFALSPHVTSNSVWGHASQGYLEVDKS